MNIELSDQQLQVIEEALQQLPYKVAAPIIEHISKQKRVVGNLVIRGSDLGQSSRDGYIKCNNLVVTPYSRLTGAQ